MERPLDKIQKFSAENGWYLLGEEATSQLARLFRGYILGRRLGTSKMQIGPDSHVRGLSRMKIGSNFRAGRGLWLEAITRYDDQVFSPRLVIGDRVSASRWVHIAATHHLEIGDDCLLGSGILITDHAHGRPSTMNPMSGPPPSKRPLDSNGRVVIGRNVWLGDGVVVLPGVEIGDGVVVGANSVVSKSIPPFAVAAGVPARTIKQFDPSTEQWVNTQQFQRDQ